MTKSTLSSRGRGSGRAEREAKEPTQDAGWSFAVTQPPQAEGA